MAANATNAEDVFINCRFDPDWQDRFEALAFAVIGCGFRVRCAKELEDAAGTRIEKLYRIIQESRFGIHDISCVQLDPVTGAAHFEVPMATGRQIIEELRSRLPGYAVPRYVQEVPGEAGKVVLA